MSCKEATIQALNEIYCSGTQSCHLAIKISGDIVYAYGYSSAFQSNIYASTVKAYGYYAISRAKIDSVNQTGMTVHSYGHYSGYGATFICRDQSECTLKCKASGCKNMDFICLNGAICSVTPNGCLSQREINIMDTDESIKGIDCPNWSESDSDEMDDTYLRYIEQKHSMDNDYDGKNYEIDIEYDVEIEEYYINDDVIVELDPEDIQTENMMVRCSEYQECVDKEYVGDGYVVYCSGSESCIGGTIGNLAGNTAGIISCSGELSCNKATLSGAGDIRCGGYQSCMNANSITGYDTSSRIECYGGESCQKINGKNSKIIGNEIECHGESSCKSSKLNSGDYVQCGGFESCMNGNIISDEGIIFCGGSDGCNNGKLYAKEKNVICSGKTACDNSVIEGSLIHFGGEQSGIWSKIKGSLIQGFGYKSMQFGMIDSEGHNIMQIKSYGYMAGIRSTIICRSGSQCELKCQSSGCFKMEIFCLSGSFCSISPIQCQQDKSITITSDSSIDCPIIKESLNKEEDEIYLKQIDKRQEYHETLFKLQDYNYLHFNKKNKLNVAMVMENEIGLPRHYHRLHLYVAIAVIGLLLIIIPITCWINNKYIFNQDEKNKINEIEEEKLIANGSRSWPLLIRRRQYGAL